MRNVFSSDWYPSWPVPTLPLLCGGRIEGRGTVWGRRQSPGGFAVPASSLGGLVADAFVNARVRNWWLDFKFILPAAIGFVTALMLTTCASPSPVVWEYYDQCGRENPSFLAMAECGRQKRLAECAPNNTCSPEGTMFMEYIDRLVLSVKKKELTEAEAMRRYTEYKAGGTPSHP
jgi:hypothetical protein